MIFDLRVYQVTLHRALEFPIRVAFVTSALPRGGAERQLVDLVHHLDRRRFQSMIVALHGGAMISDVNGNVPVFSNLGVWAGDPRELIRLIRLFQIHRPQIVNVLGQDNSALWGRLAAKLTGVPIIVNSFHHSVPHPSQRRKMAIYRMLNRPLDRWTKMFIAVSEWQRSSLNLTNVQDDRLIVIHNGIDVQRFTNNGARRDHVRRKLGLSFQTPVVGMVANLSPIKRHDVMIQALVKVCNQFPAVQCLLIGDGVLNNDMKKMAVRLGVDDRVHFLGTRQDVPELLSALDVFILSSDSESFSYAIGEAMMAGLPVVATDCGGPREIILDGETGFLVPTGTPTLLAEKIELLLRSPSLAAKMGEAGRRRIEQSFSLTTMVRDYEKLFLNLLGANGSDPAQSQMSANLV